MEINNHKFENVLTDVKNVYHNKINRNFENLICSINNKLRENYRILCHKETGEKTKTSRIKLQRKGFDFDIFMNILHTKTGDT